MKTKVTKDSRNLLIGLLLGDGTISNNFTYKLSHSEAQREYLEWKLKQLENHGIKHNGVKEYISSCGYNIGRKVLYSQISKCPFVKVLRRVFYKPKKIIGNRKLLNRLDAMGIAIWYMDDGSLKYRKTEDRIHGFYIKLHTCISLEENQIIIDYFKERWNVNFYTFSEIRGKNKYYSLCCGTSEGIKFINIVKPYVSQIPSMTYKIQYDLSQRVKPI